MSASEVLVMPPLLLLAAVMLGFFFGFFGAALMAARKIRQAEREHYWEGYSACNRAHAAAKGWRL